MKGKRRIFRNASPKQNFTTICNTLLQDERLSLEAKGLQVHVLSLKEDWEFNATWAKKTFRVGEQKLERILRELADAEYVVSEQQHFENGRFGPTIYSFTDVPGVFADDRTVKTAPTVSNRTVKNRSAVNRPAENTPHRNNLGKKIQKVEINPLTPLQGDASEKASQVNEATLATKTSSRRKARNAALDYTPNFERAWKAFPARAEAGMSKQAAMRSWEAQGCEDIAERVIAGINSYAVNIVKARKTRPETPVKHMQGWLTDRRWEAFEEAEPSSSANTGDDRTAQIKAVAVNVSKGTWTNKKWFKAPEDVPADIMVVARRYAKSSFDDAVLAAAA